MNVRNRPIKRPYPKKRFGQHFLSDKRILGRIVGLAGVSKGDHVLEIGPGRGSLTRALIHAGALVTAIEIDRDLSELLKEEFPDRDALTIVAGDALKLSFSELAKEGKARFKMVSNLPYNISGPMLAKLIRERHAFTKAVLMLQKEVADRAAAVPGTKEYGALSVIIQAYAKVKKEFQVPRGAFYPPPKVTSTVVTIDLLAGPEIGIEDEGYFLKTVKAAFAQRRKTILNSISSAMGIDREAVNKALSECGIGPGARAESLTVRALGLFAHSLKRAAGMQP
jgi:16S rRNA (adenine1518-N6/adenine1519-N6)-dimethyltransferase